jgi:hypothetical protein
MSVAYFTPDERLIYYCRKNWFPLFTFFLLGTLFFLPVTILPIVSGVPLEVELILISSSMLYFSACFLGLWGYRKSYLVLSNRRLFLRYGIFFPKDQVIPFETIESITFVSLSEGSHYLISTTDGKKIKVRYPFRWDDLEKLAGHINALKNGTTYLGPEKKKPYIFRQIAMVLVPMILALAIHQYFKEKQEAEKKRDLAQKDLQVEINKKVMKRRLMKKMTGMEIEYKRLTSLEITSNKKPAECITLWKKFLETYSDDIPGETRDERLKKEAWEMIIHFQGRLPPGDPLRSIRLRSAYNENLREEEWRSTLLKYGFFDFERNQRGSFRHQYQVSSLHGDKVVLDFAAGLMWHPGGSQYSVPYEKIPLWLNWLNRKDYAGFHDWRLPTLEEAASLLQKGPKGSKNRFIDEAFSTRESPIYTGDRFMENPLASSGQYEYWRVSYRWRGSSDRDWIRYESYIRPVRSLHR